MLEAIKDESVLKLSTKYCLSKLEANKDMFWLFNTENGDMYKMNETSFFTLSCFDGFNSIKGIKTLLMDRYEAEDSVILNDFLELLKICLDKGIIE